MIGKHMEGLSAQGKGIQRAVRIRIIIQIPFLGSL